MDRIVNSQLATATSRVIADTRTGVLVSVSCGMMLYVGFRLAFPVLLPFFRTEFQMDLTTAGGLLTILWVAFAVGQFPGGVIGDRIGERSMLVSSAVLAIITSALIAVSRSEAWLFVAVVGYGLATGLYTPVRFTVLTDLYPKKTGTVLGISGGVVNIGNVLLPVVAAFVAGIAGWRLGFGFMLPLFVLAALGLWWFVPEQTSPSVDDKTSPITHIPALFRSVFRAESIPIMIGLVCMMFLFQSFTSFYPTYLVEIGGMSESVAALVYGVFFGVAIVLMPAGGALGDWIGTKRALLVTLGIPTVAVAILPFSSHLAVFVVLTGLIGAQAGFWPVAHAALIKHFRSDIQSGAFGVVRSIYILLGASGPIIAGAIADAGFFSEVFLLIAAVGGLGGIVIFFKIPRAPPGQPVEEPV